MWLRRLSLSRDLGQYAYVGIFLDIVIWDKNFILLVQ